MRDERDISNQLGLDFTRMAMSVGALDLLYRPIDPLASANSNHFHAFEFHPRYLLYLWVVGEVDRSAFQAAVHLLAVIFERHAVAFQHQCIDDPFTSFALYMADYFYRVQLVKQAMFQQELVRV